MLLLIGKIGSLFVLFNLSNICFKFESAVYREMLNLVVGALIRSMGHYR